MNKQTQHIFSLSDAVDCMRQIPDNSIQLIIADPPYNINKATWDKIKDYTNWAAKWIEESYRIRNSPAILSSLVDYNTETLNVAIFMS